MAPKHDYDEAADVKRIIYSDEPIVTTWKGSGGTVLHYDATGQPVRLESVTMPLRVTDFDSFYEQHLSAPRDSTFLATTSYQT